MGKEGFVRNGFSEKGKVMDVSRALLRTLSNKGWDKPLSSPSLGALTAIEAPTVYLDPSSANPVKNAVTGSLRRKLACRLNAQAPQHSNQFVKASTTPLRDRRLSSTAKCLLLMIKALSGKSDKIDLITKGQLAGTIGRSRRTVQYALHELQSLGYLALETVKGCFGLYAGLRITIGMATKVFSPAEFYQKATELPLRATKPVFSDRQVAAQQITRFKYLEKKAAKMRMQAWIIGIKFE